MPGAFATKSRAPFDPMELAIDDVGAIQFPLTQKKLKRLLSRSRLSPFGLRDATLRDETVRSSTEIDGSALVLSPAWTKTLAKKLEEIRDALGLSPDRKLRAVLDKLLIYQEGQFFKQHQDTERDDAMIATLIAVLPSEHSGGVLTVKHGRKRKTFDTARQGSDDVTLIAFYADCRHEVSPVESGLRLALSYQLRLDHPRSPTTLGFEPKAIDRLSGALDDYFARALAERHGRSRSSTMPQFVYLLDHEYTQRGIDWSRLKNGDRARVAALLEAAKKRDYEAFLTLADLHEVWSCESTFGRYDRRGWGRRTHDEDEPSAEDAVPLDLIDADITLTHWLGADGTALRDNVGHAADHELCATRDTEQFTPYKREYEGYMGNYGDTLERWYHRGALVLWPRAQSFARTVLAAPTDAMQRLASARLEPATRVADCKRILAQCPSAISQDSSENTQRTVFDVAHKLGDAELALEWLAHAMPRALGSAAAMSAGVACVDAYGDAWAERLAQRWDAGGFQYEWDKNRWMHALAKRDSEASIAFARSILRKVVDKIDSAPPWKGWRPSKWLSLDVSSMLIESVANALVCAIVTRADDQLRRLEDALDGGVNAAPLAVRLAVLRSALALAPSSTQALAERAVTLSTINELRAFATAPERAVDDWRITVADSGADELSQKLDTFLRSSQETLEWPLYVDVRNRVMSMVASAAVPVECVPLRRGNPRILLLQKSRDLPALERAAREAAHRTLAALEKTLSATTE